jgi:hypothetical protein
VDGSESEFGVYAHSAGLDGLVESEILGHTQVQSGYSGITTALTIVYDDTAGLVTVSGLDSSIQASDLEMSVINTQLSSGDAGYSLAITPENIVADGGGTAVFSYSDLNRSIQDLVIVDGNAKGTVVNYTDLNVYHGAADNGQATGAQAMDNDVFTVLGYEVYNGMITYDTNGVESGRTPIEALRTITFKTETGWEYGLGGSIYPTAYSVAVGTFIPASPVDAAFLEALSSSSFAGELPGIGDPVTQDMKDALPPAGIEALNMNLSYDSSLLDPVSVLDYSSFKGTAGINVNDPGFVIIGSVNQPGIGYQNLDGEWIGDIVFGASTSDPIDVYVELSELGAGVFYDYPIGFTIEV